MVLPPELRPTDNIIELHLDTVEDELVHPGYLRLYYDYQCGHREFLKIDRRTLQEYYPDHECFQRPVSVREPILRPRQDLGILGEQRQERGEQEGELDDPQQQQRLRRHREPLILQPRHIRVEHPIDLRRRQQALLQPQPLQQLLVLPRPLRQPHLQPQLQQLLLQPRQLQQPLQEQVEEIQLPEIMQQDQLLEDQLEELQ